MATQSMEVISQPTRAGFARRCLDGLVIVALLSGSAWVSAGPLLPEHLLLAFVVLMCWLILTQFTDLYTSVRSDLWGELAERVLTPWTLSLATGAWVLNLTDVRISAFNALIYSIYE